MIDVFFSRVQGQLNRATGPPGRGNSRERKKAPPNKTGQRPPLQQGVGGPPGEGREGEEGEKIRELSGYR